jgi:hypothetical protein
MIYSLILFAVDSIYPLFSGLPDGQIRLNTGAIAWRILPSNSGLALVLRNLKVRHDLGAARNTHQSA